MSKAEKATDRIQRRRGGRKSSETELETGCGCVATTARKKRKRIPRWSFQSSVEGKCIRSVSEEEQRKAESAVQETEKKDESLEKK